MAIFTWPTEFCPQTFSQRVAGAASIVSTPFVGGEIVYDLPGSRWTPRMGWDSMLPASYRKMVGFLGQLRGPVNQVRIADPTYGGKTGGITGSPVCSGAAHATQVSVSSGTGSNPAFRQGDFVQIGNYAYVVTEDLSLSGGAGTLKIFPELRVAASSEAIVYTSPKSLYRLASSSWLDAEIDRDGTVQVELEWIEALP